MSSASFSAPGERLGGKGYHRSTGMNVGLSLPRSVLVLVAATAAVAACAGPDPTPSPGGLTATVISTDLGVGWNRLAFALLDTESSTTVRVP